VRGYNHEMTAEQHAELAEVLHGLRGHVVLSGYASEMYAALYGDWHRTSRQAFANGGFSRREVLWSNRPFHPLLEGSGFFEPEPVLP
jgi:DNA adenine methylase